MDISVIEKCNTSGYVDVMVKYPEPCLSILAAGGSSDHQAIHMAPTKLLHAEIKNKKNPNPFKLVEMTT